jgi:cell filamentation protein
MLSATYMPAMPMSKYSSSDHYVDKKTGVLRNRLGIASTSELEKAEADFASARSYELGKNPLKGRFDFEHLKAIHRYMFKDLYEWAGVPRDIDIAKGDNFFAHHTHIDVAAKGIFAKLAEEKHLVGLSKADFCDRAAFYLGEINALHPFREGNGRAQREFISHLAYKNGYYIEWQNSYYIEWQNSYYIEWQNISQDDMIQASIASFRGNCSKFAAFIRANIKNLHSDTGQSASDKQWKPDAPKP